MHSFLLSLSVLVGVVSSAVSNPSASAVGYVEVDSVAGSIEPDHVSATLSIDTDDDKLPLIISLDIGLTGRECSDSNLHLNGLPLSLDGVGTERFQFSAPSREGEGQATFEATGRLTCLRGEASLVDLRIYDTEQPDTPITALVFSYSQVGQPIIHRLLHGSPEALAPHLATLRTDFPGWTHPMHDVRISKTTVEPPAPKSDLPEGLEAQLLRLDLLKHHAEDIQKEIKATEAKIMSIWKSEFEKCSSIGCYLKTAVAKAPTLAHLIASHLSHHTHIDAEFFHKSAHMNCTMEVDNVVEQHEKQMVLGNTADEAAEPKEEADAVEVVTAVEDAVEAADEVGEKSSDVDAEDEQDDSRPWTGGRPPWRHGPPGNGGPPPWARPGGRPPWAQGGKPPFGRPPWARPGSRPPWATEENPTPAASGPSEHQSDTSYSFWPFSLTPQDRFKIAAFLGAAIVVGIFTITLACCLCVRRGCMFLRDPRFKAECRARREERRTRALYRKAACKYRLRTLLQRIRRPFSSSSSDYEEKRELLTNNQEDMAESAGILGPQLERLRTFHEFLFREVSRRAEADSARVAEQAQAQPGQMPPAELDDAAAAAERAGSVRSETLPAYSLPPPSYRNGLGSEFSVVTGFTGYTPSGSEDTPDDSTVSSVVDCSPRLSFESQRTGTTRTRE